MQEEILEGNKLIAEFMGAIINTTKHKHIHFYEHLIPFKDGSGNYAGECNGITCAVDDLEGGFLCVNGLKYHSYWDWLMPVVEKIEGDEVDLNISVVIKKNKCGIYRHKNSPYEIQLFLQESKSKKEAVWLAVVEFIKFYNQQ